MKIRLKFEKENLGRLGIAMILAAVLYVNVHFALWVLFAFGGLYFLIKSLHIELGKWASRAGAVVLLAGSSVFTVHLIQYLLLDAELRAKITQEKMWLNIVCCLVVFLTCS